MLFFPNCKINLGLNVIKKRSDGYHDIETVFYPVNWPDALEILENEPGSPPFSFTSSGLHIAGNMSDNLIFKAWQLMCRHMQLPPIKVHLHKNIPMGAGLGGGSSDAAFFINMINSRFEMGLSVSQKTEIASKLGSDCAFFIENKPVLAKGKGNEFSPVKVDLSPYYIAVVYPSIHSNTAEAYRGLCPKEPEQSLSHIIETKAIEEWKNSLVNDFESSLFKKYPEIEKLKEKFYQTGALYSSMSGSGSAVYAIYKSKPELTFPSEFKYFLQNPVSEIL